MLFIKNDKVLQFPLLDILVNNAGLIRPGKITKATEEDWDLQIDVNLKGPFLMSNNFLPYMNAGGSILNISSTVVRTEILQGTVNTEILPEPVVNYIKDHALYGYHS